jgi:integrase
MAVFSAVELHIMPWFGDLALDRITPAIVRLWRNDLLRQGRSVSTAAKSYRLLRAILNTAVRDDHLLRENPYRMRGFDKEPTSERPTASVDQVWRLAALMPRRFRALVIFAAYTGLRWGELAALRVRDVDLDTGVVHVVRSSLNCRTANGFRAGRSQRPVSAPWPCPQCWWRWYAST